MSNENNALNDPEIVRLLGQPGPLLLKPSRLRWSLGLLAHVAFVAVGVLAYRDGYVSPMGAVGLTLFALFLPLTLAHALRLGCYIKVDHDGIHQVIAGWRRFYRWSDLSAFSLRRLQGRTYVIFNESKGGKVRERSLGLTYGMKPEQLMRFLHLKHLMLQAAADPQSKAA